MKRFFQTFNNLPSIYLEITQDNKAELYLDINYTKSVTKDYKYHCICNFIGNMMRKWWLWRENGERKGFTNKITLELPFYKYTYSQFKQIKYFNTGIHIYLNRVFMLIARPSVRILLLQHIHVGTDRCRYPSDVSLVKGIITTGSK